MEENTGLPISLGTFMVRTLACLLLAGSLVMLFFPWVSLRLNSGGQRVTLRQMADSAEQRSGQSFRDAFLVPLGQRDEGMYTGVLRELDPLLDDRMSPLRTGLACLGVSRWMDDYSQAYRLASEPDGETERWAQNLRSAAEDLHLAGVLLLGMLGLLLLSGGFAVYSAAAGKGLGLLPYGLCAVPAMLGAALASGRCNAWYQGDSDAAGLLRSAVESFSLPGNPVTTPFRLGLGGLLFGILAAVGLLLAVCTLGKKEEGRARRSAQAAPAPIRQAPAAPRPDPGRPLPKAWRCRNCGTLMGDGVYCVKCGSRKPEPRRCPACGAIVKREGAFCGSCGQPLPRRAEAERPGSGEPGSPTHE